MFGLKKNGEGGKSHLKCDRKPGLHPGNCFKKYHTLKIYKNYLYNEKKYSTL